MINFLKRIRGYFCIGFICLVLAPINLTQIMTLVLLPLNRRWFMRCNMAIAEFFGSSVVATIKLCGNEIIFTGDEPRQENALIFANHQSVLDIILVWAWGVKPGTVGWIKWFAKDVLKYVPGIGWGLQFINTLFVKRNWAQDADMILRTFAKLRNGALPTWLVIFPEGTRMTPVKLAASQEFAKKRGAPILQHVLVPRGKGVHASLQGLEGHLKVVYDVTIFYDEKIPSMGEFYLKGGFKTRFHAVRHEIATVPTRERDLNQWLVDRFVEKDKLMSRGLRSSSGD